MQEEKGLRKQEETWRKSLYWLTRTAVLLALTLAFQMLGLPQPVTGPAVNAMLLLSAIFVGALGGVAIGLFTPWVAFMRGILAAPLGPMIPFIMIGNAALVLAFSAIRNAGRKALWAGIVGIIAAAIVKFLILSAAVRYVVEVKPAIARAMQVPQLFTALTGGIIALVVAGAIQAAVRGRKL